MKPVTIGIIAAAAVIVAFIAGTWIETENDGPAEKLGEAIDNIAENPPAQ